jgi:hypothetical protein
MDIKDHIDTILKRKMERKEFIQQIALAVVVLSGAGTALRLLSAKSKPSQDTGYGSSAYGGRAGGPPR